VTSFTSPRSKSSKSKPPVKKLLVAGAALCAAASLALSACTGAPSDSKVAKSAPTHLSGSVSLWHHYSDREAEVIQSVVDGFTKANPDVHVQVRSGQEDTKIAQVVATSSDADVVLTNVNNTLGTLCKSMVDLQPYMQRDHVPESDFGGIFADATSFDGRRCSLPTTSDVYGLYYNKKLLAKAGYSKPPETLQELQKMALKMTTYNADGSIKTLGFDPLIGFGQNTSATFGASAGAKWMDGDKASIASSPQWKQLIGWQKGFIDKIGYAKLKRFTSGLGDEFSANNPFEMGRIAMTLDGEWRVAFIDADKSDIQYGTAPFPVLSGSGQTLGGGYASAADVGISNKSKNKEAAWALVKYLTANTDAAVELANGLKNIPTLKAAANSPNLSAPAPYKTFITASQNPNSKTSPVTAIGSTLTQTMDDYWNKYQSGNGDGLNAGLTKVDDDINNALELRGAH